MDRIRAMRTSSSLILLLVLMAISKGVRLDFVVDDPGHHVIVTLAKGLHGGHAQA